MPLLGHESSIQERDEPLCRSSSPRHDNSSFAAPTRRFSAHFDASWFASMMMSTTFCGALSSGV
jgi:hypothetical protein